MKGIIKLFNKIILKTFSVVKEIIKPVVALLLLVSIMFTNSIMCIALFGVMYVVVDLFSIEFIPVKDNTTVDL